MFTRLMVTGASGGNAIQLRLLLTPIAEEFADLTPYEAAIDQRLLTYQGGVWLKAPLITKS